MNDLERMSVEYLERTPDRDVDAIFIEAIAERVTARLAGRTCIELGIGDRMWTPTLLERFDSVVSVDGSETLVATAAAELNNPRWQGVASYFEDFAPDRRFDVVLATYVLEHVDDPGLILRRAHDWLVPGGEVALVVPNAGSLHRRMGQLLGYISDPTELGEADHRLGHKRVFTVDSLRETVASSGYDVLEIVGFMAKPLPNALLTQCSREQLRALVDLGTELPLEMAGALMIRAKVRS